ncbi:MAG: substrate-binding domain-containing protein [Treponema sp.]|nr:substrate-binding domain-containing protein [Treponema sp.]
MGKGLLLAMMLPLVCGNCARGRENRADSVSAATAKGPATRPPARVLREQYMPAAMADGIVKIAVLVNLPAGDQSRQFLEGCVNEGRSMGFTVDTFISGADKDRGISRCGEIVAGIARADYDGLIFAYGEADGEAADDPFIDMFKPVAQKGIKIVTFETFSPQISRLFDGLITTFQNDAGLARMSLEVLLSYTRGNANRPVRVIRIGGNPGIPSLDRRTQIFDEYVRMGALVEAAYINLGAMENPDHTAWEGLADVLPRFPPGSVDALWTPHDKIAEGCVQALASMGRQDIKLVSIGISNDDIRMMQSRRETWLANVAVDPKLAGTVNMRILTAALAGETLPDTVLFTPQLLKAADLNHAVNIVNISAMVPSWGDAWGLFDHYPWMNELKKAEEKYLRILPTSMTTPVTVP